MTTLATLTCEEVDLSHFSEQRHRIKVTYDLAPPPRKRFLWAFQVLFTPKKRLLVTSFEVENRHTPHALTEDLL